jgi:hypothetical protein
MGHISMGHKSSRTAYRQYRIGVKVMRFDERLVAWKKWEIRTQATERYRKKETEMSVKRSEEEKGVKNDMLV